MQLMEYQIDEVRDLVKKYAANCFDGFLGAWAETATDRQTLIDLIEKAQLMGDPSGERNTKAQEFYAGVIQKQAEMLELIRYVAHALNLRNERDDERTMKNLRGYVKSQTGIALRKGERYEPR
jgi:hypothetical protein